MPHDSTEKFPDEVLLQIFEYVLRNDPKQALFANNRWHQISQDEGLWKKLYGYFVGDPERIPPPVTKGIYRKQCLRILKEYQKIPDKHKLGYSVYHGYDQLLKSFLEKNQGVDLHFKGEQKQNLIHAIHLAASRGHLNLFDILLAQNPLIVNIVNAQDIIGWTPLHYACVDGRTEIVKTLLSKDARIDLTDIGSPLTARILMFGKTKIRVTTEGKQILPLHIAAEEGHLEIVDLFLNYIAENKEHNITLGEIPNKQDRFGWTALHYACAHGHLKVVENLIAAGTRIDLVTSEGKNPLHIAADKGHSKIVKLLLEHVVKKADNDAAVKEFLNKPEQLGWTALHCVCAQGDLEIVKMLIAAGADTNIPTNWQKTVLHIACENNHEDIAKYLPTVSPALVHARDNRHWSVMHYVCRAANFELIKFFVEEYNVSVLQAADGTITPRDLVPSDVKNRKIIRFLEEHNKEGYRKFDKVKSGRNILFVIGSLFFLLMIAFPLASPYLKVPETLAIIGTFSAAGGCLLTAIGGFLCYGLSLGYLHKEIENSQENVEAEKEPLLRDHDGLEHNSYATFTEELSKARDHDHKDYREDVHETVLTLDEESLTDKRKKVRAQPIAIPSTRNKNDIEIGDTKEKKQFFYSKSL